MIAREFPSETSVTFEAVRGERVDVDRNGYSVAEATVVHNTLVPTLRRALHAKNGGEKFKWDVDYPMDYNDRLNATIATLKDEIYMTGKIVNTKRIFTGLN